ncbi:MAG: PHP domain-containing protein, partial [Dehalococcoidia bacterium]|nr:PHP domain-containing protein [Dehalococcoidia bacterium]
MLIDLHTHTTPNSDDSFLSPTELILQAKKSGLDGICLTEHDWYWSHEAVAQLARESDFVVIPGVETNTEDGHVIAFGIDKFKFGMHRLSFLRQMVDEKGGFMILAHPFRRNFYSQDNIDETVEKLCQKGIFKYLDTIETLNGRGKERQNQFSAALGKKLGWQGIGGSDAHELKDTPTCATHFERNVRNLEELIQELKAGRYKPVDLREK